MLNKLKDNWNRKYQEETYAYGKNPNEFFKNYIDNLKPGKALFVAEGEGRNAVYAAQLGWEVCAFDISEEGKSKAEKLAAENEVSIDYQLGLLPELNFLKEEFDLIVLIFAHFPPTTRLQYHYLLNQYLKKGGIIILEAFGENNLEYRKDNPNVGGPQNLEMLYSVEQIKSDFENYNIIQLEEKESILAEGKYHNGRCSLINFIGIKKV